MLAGCFDRGILILHRVAVFAFLMLHAGRTAAGFGIGHPFPDVLAGRFDRGIFILHRVAVLAFLMLHARSAAARFGIGHPFPDVLAGSFDRGILILHRVAVVAFLMLHAGRAAAGLGIGHPFPDVFTGRIDRGVLVLHRVAVLAFLMLHACSPAAGLGIGHPFPDVLAAVNVIAVCAGAAVGIAAVRVRAERVVGFGLIQRGHGQVAGDIREIPVPAGKFIVIVRVLLNVCGSIRRGRVRLIIDGLRVERCAGRAADERDGILIAGVIQIDHHIARAVDVRARPAGRLRVIGEMLGDGDKVGVYSGGIGRAGLALGNGRHVVAAGRVHVIMVHGVGGVCVRAITRKICNTAFCIRFVACR